MKSVEFCYWLQGFFELADQKALTELQTEMVKKHLAMVFKHEIDRSYPKHQQPALDALHGGKPQIGGTSVDGSVLYRC